MAAIETLAQKRLKRFKKEHPVANAIGNVVVVLVLAFLAFLIHIFTVYPNL